MHQVYGIRHHGPGSALALTEALKRQAPDCLLIEGPFDANHCLDSITDKALRPPVAILVYRKKEFNKAAYFPFTTFSPEWVAMKYGYRKGILTQLIDLPQSLQFELEDRKGAGIQVSLFQNEFLPSQQIKDDPLSFFAQIAGYDDVERWWEVTFEHEASTEIFPAISRMMHIFRKESGENSLENTFREAFMRTQLREAIAKGYSNIAVVCGAWHLPGLEDLSLFPERADDQLLNTLKTRKKIDAQWIPWSYDRITKEQYGAGITSPAWYELLHQKKKTAATYWMAKVANLLRQKKLDVASSATIEAVRLANTLAAIRGLAIPGLAELKEAALSVITEGDATPMLLIERKLIIGDKIGKVPSNQLTAPIQKDLIKRVKKGRLTKFFESTEPVTRKLDLRVSSNIEASQLIHQLQVLHVPWGKKNKGPKGQTGSFAEHWRLKWKPDFMIRIIEAGMWGKTILEAATAMAINRVNEQENPSDIAQLLDLLIHSHLPLPAEKAVTKLEEASALSKDVFKLMQMIPSVVSILQYGSTRIVPEQALRQLINQVCPRIYAMLPGAVRGLNDDIAREKYDLIASFHQAMVVYGEGILVKSWYRCLSIIMHGSGVPAFLAGISLRLLFDKKQIGYEEVALRIAYSLSERQDPIQSANWLEGFLKGSGLILFYHQQLWDLLNRWVSHIPNDRFDEVLPLIRRAFSSYEPAERRRILNKAKQESGTIKNQISHPTDNPMVWNVAKMILVD